MFLNDFFRLFRRHLDVGDLVLVLFVNFNDRLVLAKSDAARLSYGNFRCEARFVYAFHKSVQNGARAPF